MTLPKVVTFGCRLNTYESQLIEQIANKIEQPVTIFNTCAVTEEAERQAKQAIRKAYRADPSRPIIVTGCAAQLHPENFLQMPEVSRVLGNQEKLIAENYLTSSAELLVNDIMTVKETALHLVDHFEGKARGFLQIQNGCNHRCTYCIIPYARGNNRSIPIGAIVQQVRLLVEKGYKEIVFTGVDITDYGLDLPGKPSLGQLIKRLLDLVPDLARLRLSSIDIAEVDEDLRQLIRVEKRLMPHFHISLQSGDNMILKRMKRRHVREQVIEFCNEVRSYRSEAAFGADIITGFPTETEEMFMNSMNLVNEAGLTYLHVFPYSIRAGTPAARMPQIAKAIRKERAARLREAGKLEMQKFLQKQIGKRYTVLVENNNIARAENFAQLKINGIVSAGSLVEVQVMQATEEYLIANLVGAP